MGDCPSASIVWAVQWGVVGPPSMNTGFKNGSPFILDPSLVLGDNSASKSHRGNCPFTCTEESLLTDNSNYILHLHILYLDRCINPSTNTILANLNKGFSWFRLGISLIVMASMLLENQYSLTAGDIPYTAGPPWRNEWTIILPTLVKNPLLHKNDIWDWNLVVYLSLKKKCEFRFLRWKTVLHHSHTKAKEFPNWSTPESSFIVKPYPYPGTETGIRLFVNIHLITCKFHLHSIYKRS